MKRLYTILIAALTVLTAAADVIPDMKFRRLDTQDGLSNSQVNCVFRDSRGFIWIGTPYGLNRYDGYRFRTYYSNLRDTTSMRDNYTDQIFEAYDGRLWLKQGMNYCVYDPVSDRFERNAQRALSKYGINGGVERLYIDHNKNFWVKLYEQGIFYYNPKTKRLHQFKLGYEKNEFNPTYGISTIADMGDQVVVATNCGELICLDGERGTVVWENKWMRQNGGEENQDYKLLIDRDKNFWVVSLSNTYIYIRKENRWYKTLSEYLLAHGLTDAPAEMQVWAVLIDNKGWLWAATDHEGLLVADVKSRQLKQFKNSKFDETTVSDNTQRNLYQDANGRIWIGTYKNGVNQYVEGLSSIHSLELGDINTVAEDRHGNYWIGTNDVGILVYNPKTGEVVNHFTKENSAMTGNIVVGSWAASDGSLWFGSYNGGLTHCIPSASNPTQATVVNYQATGQSGGLANSSVWALTEDKWGRIWFTTLGGGVQMLDPKTGKFRTWDPSNTKLPSGYLTSINWNRKGWMLLGTSWYYALLNPVTGQLLTRELPEDPNVTVNITSTTYIIEDSRGLLWHGSTSGVTVYDPKTKFMTLLDMTKGLYGSSINSITEDHRKTIWVVTDHGVSNIVPQRQEDGTWQFIIRSFNSRDGLQKAVYNQRSTWVTRDGLLLVGGQGGLDVIDPSKLQRAESKERPVFSGLQIFDRDVPVGEKVDGRVILKKALDACEHIYLRFNDQFTIQLATDEVTIHNHHRFAYMLEGFNDNWVKTAENNPNITYNSLRAGNYKLRVRILKDDGTLGEQESTLAITIRPPLWRTRWMVLLYMLLIGAVALLWRKRFMKHQRERMQLELLRREAEKKQWMSEMRKQMAQERGDGQSASFVVEPTAATATDTVTSSNLHLTPTDLTAFVKEQCDGFPRPADKNLRMTYVPMAHNLKVDIDRERMGQAIQSLLSNAVKFSPSNCRVRVFVEQVEQIAKIRISDNGIGIPEDAREHMFEPLLGEDDGIALFRVKDIVVAHGGNITADDNPGGGTVFVITLPLSAEEEVEEAVMMED